MVEEAAMYGNYLVLCGMVWTHFGKQDAGLELIRALDSEDENVRVLARILLQQGGAGSKELIGEALAQDEISLGMAQLCSFDPEETGNIRDTNWTARWSAAEA
jgi:hypothetical protein